MPTGALGDLGIRIGVENQGQEIRHPLRGVSYLEIRGFLLEVSMVSNF